MAIVLTETEEFDVASSEGLSLTAADAARITGWTLKPEGMCRDEVCVPWTAPAGRVDLAAFWRHLGQPVANEGDVWALGTGADQRRAALQGLEAPDFTLPDLDGRMHVLSDQRGRKVLLTTWASW